MERMGVQVNEKEKRRMNTKNRGQKGGRNSTSRSEDSCCQLTGSLYHTELMHVTMLFWSCYIIVL